MLNETRRNRVALYVGIATFLLVALLPYYWVFRTSLLTSFAAIRPEGPFVPFLAEAFTIQNYVTVFENYNFPLYFRNSIIVSLGSTALSLVFAIPGAYAFARLDFPGRKLLFYTAVFTIMFPWIVITIPVYEVYFNLGLLNTMHGVVIALAIFILPLCLWLLQGFFRQGIPENIEEAALIDGTTRVGAFFRVVLPLSMPAIAATALFSFLNAWNNFLWVFILTSDQSVRTATVAIHYILGSDTLREWNILMAAVVLLVLPPVLFYGVSQRYVGEGLGGSM
ncbi:carbohydrate ABC transporter permease [Halosimplex aquaticum]|uniref:Carbohydrate ABC transporter permease n=1 Tax=Halosimplex aquaticum TaxID=3026162 RepID=A0ABD5Y2J4_9EURY|nr:carbohydrate ABC transporter permease [Halosimplex aquaticum]